MYDKVKKPVRLGVAFFLTLAALACLAVVMVAGLRIPKGQVDRLSFAVIDSSKVETKISEHTFKGLPDAHDFSRYKDFYSFHLWNYCSGNIENGSYNVNFCSQARQPLYDLFGFWKVWGASVERPDARFSWLERGPKLMYVSYMVTAGLKGLEVLASLPSLFTKRTNVVTLALSTTATIAFMITSALSQVTYRQLISRADDEDIAITAFSGPGIVYAVNWVGACLSLLGAALWYQIHFSTTIHRAATMNTSAVSSITSGIQSPTEYRMLQSPVRQRTLTNWPRYDSEGKD